MLNVEPGPVPRESSLARILITWAFQFLTQKLPDQVQILLNYCKHFRVKVNQGFAPALPEFFDSDAHVASLNPWALNPTTLHYHLGAF